MNCILIGNQFLNGTHAEQQTMHNPRSSNFIFNEYVFSIAKSCRGVTGIRKFFPLMPQPQLRAKKKEKIEQRLFALVDIVAQDGSEWVKVCAITEKRVMWDYVKAGFADADLSDDLDSSEEVGMEEEDDPTGIVKQVKALVKASHLHSVRFKNPRIRVVFSRLRRNGSKQVKDLLSRVEALGVIIQTLEDICAPPPMANVLHQFVGKEFATFSKTLNIDCSILLALASDISHGMVESQEWHLPAIQRQMEWESEHLFLPNQIWPAFRARKLICTRESFDKMHEIVENLATETERKRAALLFGRDENSNVSLAQERCVEGLQKLSSYTIPLSWSLPIQIIDADIFSMKSQLPSYVDDVLKDLLPVNQSVFLYGWTSCKTTITSNGVVARALKRLVEENMGDGTNIILPDIYVSRTSRSLVGKEKERYNDTSREGRAEAREDNSKLKQKLEKNVKNTGRTTTK